MRRPLCLSLVLVAGFSLPATAQNPAAVGAGTAAAEISGNYTSFFDDGAIDHAGLSGALRVHLTPRISVGPELAYLVGPGRDRDVLLLGNVAFDFRRPMAGLPGRVEPYVVVGAGLLAHTTGSWSGVSEAVVWGGGARVWVSRRVYVGSDVRLGWHPHLRVSGTVGIIGQSRGDVRSRVERSSS
jgi:hypothetical protein